MDEVYQGQVLDLCVSLVLFALYFILFFLQGEESLSFQVSNLWMYYLLKSTVVVTLLLSVNTIPLLLKIIIKRKKKKGE